MQISWWVSHPAVYDTHPGHSGLLSLAIPPCAHLVFEMVVSAIDGEETVSIA